MVLRQCWISLRDAANPESGRTASHGLQGKNRSDSGWYREDFGAAGQAVGLGNEADRPRQGCAAREDLFSVA